MRHYILICLIIVTKFATGTKSSEDTDEFRLKICKIIKTGSAPMNIVYKLKRENVKSSSKNPWALEENWNGFYGCLAQIPIVLRELEKHSQEPLRTSASTSIFFMDTLKSMRQVVDFLNAQQKWKPGHCYVFIWLIPDKQALKRFFEKVWQKNILNVITAVVRTQEIYTFEPFTEQGFQVKPLFGEPYFYDKLKNFHHFQLRISMFKDNIRAVPLDNYTTQGYRKVDGMMARTIVEHLNATALYIKPSDNQATYGDRVNGSFNGALKDIQSGFTHIGFNYRFTLDDVKPYIEELYPYKKRLLYLLVPAAKMKPEYLIFANAFSYSLWRLLLINFLLVLLIFFILQKLVERLPCRPPQNSLSNWHWHELLHMFVKTHIGQPVEHFSHTSSLRQFLITWILFSYVLTSIYFAKLESSFVQPLYEKEIDRLDDLTELKVPIYGFNIAFEAVQVSLDPRYFRIINNHGIRVPPHIGDDEFFMNLQKKRRNIALIVRDELAKTIVANSYNNETKRPTFHIVNEYLRSLTASYVLHKGSPFIHKFQTVVSNLYEHGLVSHWLDVDSQQRNYLHRSEVDLEDLENDFILEDSNEAAGGILSSSELSKNKVVLNMEILQGAFYLWFSGICLSVIGFLAEHLFWRFKLRKQRRMVAAYEA